MKLRDDSNVLVIVGGWNKYIFNPEWVAKFLLINEELQVEYPLNFDGSTRISSKAIRVFVQDNRLNFVPIKLTNENLELVHDLAIKTADYLPHTPVQAFGINFIFDMAINPSITDLLVLKDIERINGFDTLVKNVQYRRTFEIEKNILNLTITSDNMQVSFDFNFHFDISSLVEFKEKMGNYYVLELKEKAISFMRTIYGLELD